MKQTPLTSKKMFQVEKLTLLIRDTALAFISETVMPCLVHSLKTSEKF